MPAMWVKYRLGQSLLSATKFSQQGKIDQFAISIPALMQKLSHSERHAMPQKITA